MRDSEIKHCFHRGRYLCLKTWFRTRKGRNCKRLSGRTGGISHAPFQTVPCNSLGTLEKWYLFYRKSGFDALVPTGRSDCGVSRKIDEDLKFIWSIIIPGCPQLRYINSSRITAASAPASFQNLRYAVLSTSSSYRKHNVDAGISFCLKYTSKPIWALNRHMITSY